jgi:photosystem II stability/assembly factor-like uncharacterized protein
VGLLPVGYCIAQNYIVPVSDNVVWILAYDCNSAPLKPQKLLRTLNSGETWQVFDVPVITGQFGLSMVAFDSLTVLISTSSSVYKTIDGGRTWAKKLTYSKEYDFFKFSDKRNGIVISVENNIIANTADGGDTWTIDSTTQRGFAGETISFGPPVFHKDTISFMTRVDTLGTSRLPRLFRSTDKGKTWQRFSLPNTPAWNDAYTTFKNGNNGLMATVLYTDQGTPMSSLQKTSNGGETWEVIPNLPSFFSKVQIPSIAYIPNTNNSYVLMGINTAFSSQFTTNGGQTWNTITNIPIPTGVGNFTPGIPVFSSPKVGWVTLSTDKFSPKIYKIDLSSVISSSKDILENISLTVSPNPSTGIINIECKNADNTSPQYLKVSDALGKMVFEKKELDMGATSQSIDLQGLANGIYFIEMQSKENRGSKKLVIQH